jgi:hypothetical protein
MFHVGLCGVKLELSRFGEEYKLRVFDKRTPRKTEVPKRM